MDGQPVGLYSQGRGPSDGDSYDDDGRKTKIDLIRTKVNSAPISISQLLHGPSQHVLILTVFVKGD